MRFVPSIKPVMPSPVTRQVKGLYAVHAIKPVHPHEQPVPNVEHHATHEQTASLVERNNQRDVLAEERRKACRRVSHQHVLIELRSGIDRRHRNLREGDIAEHIDEQA